jgi:hypothetical protein
MTVQGLVLDPRVQPLGCVLNEVCQAPQPLPYRTCVLEEEFAITLHTVLYQPTNTLPAFSHRSTQAHQHYLLPPRCVLDGGLQATQHCLHLGRGRCWYSPEHERSEGGTGR